MLKLRLLTAFILGPLVIWAIFALPDSGFTAFVAVITLIGGWEWTRLAQVPGNIYKAVFLIVLSTILVAAWKYILVDPSLIFNLMLIISVFWIGVTLWLTRFRHQQIHNLKSPLAKSLVGLVVLCGFFVALVELRNSPAAGPGFLMSLIALIWTADTAAYFTGKRWGKRKLLYNVSPGKSWEGVYGAFVACSLVAVGYSTFLDLSSTYKFFFVVLCLLIVIVSVSGDLFESFFKRQADLKDSSNILPGHGGVLDRMDSLLAAAPVCVTGLYALGVIK